MHFETKVFIELIELFTSPANYLRLYGTKIVYWFIDNLLSDSAERRKFCILVAKLHESSTNSVPNPREFRHAMKPLWDELRWDR